MIYVGLCVIVFLLFYCVDDECFSELYKLNHFGSVFAFIILCNEICGSGLAANIQKDYISFVVMEKKQFDEPMRSVLIWCVCTLYLGFMLQLCLKNIR